MYDQHPSTHHARSRELEPGCRLTIKMRSSTYMHYMYVEISALLNYRTVISRPDGLCLFTCKCTYAHVLVESQPPVALAGPPGMMYIVESTYTCVCTLLLLLLQHLCRLYMYTCAHVDLDLHVDLVDLPVGRGYMYIVDLLRVITLVDLCTSRIYLCRSTRTVQQVDIYSYLDLVRLIFSTGTLP